MVVAVTGLAGAWPVAPAAGWAAAAATFDLWVWLAVAPMDAAQTRRHASQEDPSRASTDVLMLIAAVASLGAVGAILIAGKDSKGLVAGFVAGGALLTVALSWLLIHTLFTLKYARLYYQSPAGGIDFNQDEDPRYTDFAYVAFTVGMTFQVSDTDLKTHAIRATALRHMLLAYLFGAVILASIINLIAGLSSGGG